MAPLTAIRAVYARGISRPNQYDLVPYFLDNGAGSVPRYSIGNPSELPTHANNYDVLVEQQLKPFGLIQVGYFYKQLNNPIVTTYTAYAPASSDPAGDGYPDIAAQNINAAGANVSGLEFAWDQRFTNLPGSLAGLGARANYAYTQSHTNGIPDRTDHPPLIGQARHAFNLEPYYERGRYQVHFAMSYNGANDQAYQYFDNYPDPTQDTPGGPGATCRQLLLSAHANRCAGQRPALQGVAAHSGRTEYEQRGLRILQRQPSVHDPARILQAHLLCKSALVVGC